ncbi:growth arrest and DNA damage-inducible protein GADD45 beta isoform X2 [Erinaceus europaeus]|uniref:Growth arrest and DNA damage-inducible protein GADD45 beta isoform X2 n=1 Tax=Erinaceus europaeus TaxID=9365 RepID=A0A1S2ZUT4_ERIEU|nr:growth arrest and DNA damage-inducible protein GADD45 beta isoform X2 [Erinaceus europaeus]
MTLEELPAGDSAAHKMQTVRAAVEELLVAAQHQDRLTVGVHEAATLMNVDPDCVLLCLLAQDEEQAGDAGLQLLFTLLQAFCCGYDIQVLRVSGMGRLAQLLGEPPGPEARDLHCLLVTTPPADAGETQGLVQVSSFCQELRDRGVPSVSLLER